jgi:hypothetical protein
LLGGDVDHLPHDPTGKTRRLPTQNLSKAHRNRCKRTDTIAMGQGPRRVEHVNCLLEDL